MSRRRIGGHGENGRRAAHMDVAEPHFFQLPLLGGTAYVRLRTLDTFLPLGRHFCPCDNILANMIDGPQSHHLQIISALADVYSAGYDRLRAARWQSERGEPPRTRPLIIGDNR